MPDPSEQWRPVLGFDGRYEVSDQGRVRSWVRVGRWQADGWKRRPAPVIRKPYLNRRTGYWTMTLRLPDRYITLPLHRLVLEAFVGPRPAGQEACHDDGDRANNSLSNLRWDTRSSNARDRVRHGTNYLRPAVRDAVTGRYVA